MFRFFTLAWNPLDPAAQHLALELCATLQCAKPPWDLGMIRAGLAVYHFGASQRKTELLVFPDNSGMLLGTLYPMQPESTNTWHSYPASLEPHHIARIRSSHGRSLIDDFWGSYILIQQEQAGAPLRLLRSPMGDITCFYLHYQGVHLFFSFLQDCLMLGIGALSVNIDYLRAIAVFGDPRTHETALNEVFTLDVGECITLHQERLTRSRYWSPSKIVSSQRIQTVKEATMRLRAVTRWCVHASTTQHPSIALLMSGGLDSSIVAACLRDAPSHPKIMGLNHQFAGITGNEHRFARTVAEKCGFALMEIPQGGDTDLAVLHSVEKSPCPGIHFSGKRAFHDTLAAAGQCGATAIFSGSMGDCVFGRSDALLAPAEFVQQHGVRPALLRICYDVGTRKRLSIWRVLGLALRHGLIDPPRGPWSHYLHEKSNPNSAYLRSRMITREASIQFERSWPRFVHPWFEHVEELPIGKLVSIAALTQEKGTDNPYFRPDDIPIIRPLASQPLVECSLAIESHLNVKDGWDRAIARLSFADDLPPDVLRRNSKGSPAMTIREIVDRNAQFIRTFLLDGVLVKHNILDGRLIESSLPSIATKAPSSAVGIMEHLYTEAWARRWVAPANRTPSKPD